MKGNIALENKLNNTKSLFLSIVGCPNVGKSSLMNMIINSKVSIVSAKPQTTRGKITGILTHGDTQLVFSDTPGLHSPRNKLGDYMVAEVNTSLSGAEMCLHVVEAGKQITETDKKIIKKFINGNMDAVLIINKIDKLKDKTKLISEIDSWSKLFDYKAIIPVSAKTGDGRAELVDQLCSFAKPSVFFFDENDVTDQTERMLVSEVVREKMLRLLDDELPHGIAVEVEQFKDKTETESNIEAVIYCEKPNHKSIIIGKNGSMIKNIGTSARLELQEMFERKINLKLWVKVKENWRNKDMFLRSLGYSENSIN